MKHQNCNECYTQISPRLIRRGCIGDDFIKSAENCSDPALCNKCSYGNSCNIARTISKSCLVCNSIKDEDCRTESVLFKYEKLCSYRFKFSFIDLPPWNGCYHLENYTKNSVERGCVDDLKSDEVDDCKKNPTKCKICNSHDCNSKLSFVKCYSCSFNKTNSGCDIINDSIQTKTCDSYNDICFSFMYGLVPLRGCKNEMTLGEKIACEEAKGKCITCKTKAGEPCNDVDLTVD